MKRWNGLWFCLLSLISHQAVMAEEAASPVPSPKSSAPASFQVRNKKYGELLRPEDANSANRTRIVLYPAQPWKCMTWKFHPAGDSAFQLQNHFTSKTFSATPASDQAAQPVLQLPFAKEAGERPIWHFTKLADGSYRITDAKSAKVLTAVKDNTGLRVVAQAWQDQDDQKWELLPIDPKQLTM
jgi:hypothetical protein